MKKLVCLLSLVCLLLPFTACTSRLEAQEQQETLINRINELEEENFKLKERVEELERFQINYMAENYGLLPLEEAYAQGILSRENIKHISYYLTGSVYEVSDGNADWKDSADWEKTDFSPEKELSVLNKNVEAAIKLNYYYQNPDAFKNGNGDSYGTEVLHVRFLGEYSGRYAVIIENDLGGYGGAVIPVNIDGIVWEQSGAPINVFYCRQ